MRICLIPMLALLLASSVEAKVTEEGKQGEKNLCLLYMENCPDRKDTILETIAKLKKEIEKGTRVYTPTELNLLQRKLEEYESLYDIMMFSPTR